MSQEVKQLTREEITSVRKSWAQSSFIACFVVLSTLFTVASYGQDIPIPNQNNGQQNQRPLPNISISNPLNLASRSISVHVTGDVPLTGVIKVPVGARVDEVLFGFDILNKQQALEQNRIDFRNILVFTQNGDTLYSDLLAYNYGGDLSQNV
ncbi:MAG TPA: hypothetical protein DEF03_01790, partial [Bacteroidetes bacterium]